MALFEVWYFFVVYLTLVYSFSDGLQPIPLPSILTTTKNPIFTQDLEANKELMTAKNDLTSDKKPNAIVTAQTIIDIDDICKNPNLNDMCEETNGSLFQKEDNDAVIWTEKEQLLSLEKLKAYDDCKLFGTCQMASNSKFQFCHCDDLCRMYDDCCLDSNKTGIDSNISFQCVPTTNKAEYFGIKIINTCPSQAGVMDDRSKCAEKFIPSVGPLVMDDEGLVYQNKYCAQCHGKEKYRQFTVKINSCKDKTIYHLQNNPLMTFQMKLEMMIYECSYIEQIPPDRSLVRPCVFVKSSDETNVECRDYFLNPVFGNQNDQSVLYRNIFCVPKFRNVSCVDNSYYKLLVSLADKTVIPFPLSVLFFSEKSIGGCNTNNDQDCKADDFLMQNVPVENWFEYVIPSNWTYQQKSPVIKSFWLSFPTEIMYKEHACYEDTSTLIITCKFRVAINKILDQYGISEYKQKMTKYKWQNTITIQGDTIVDTYAILLPETPQDNMTNIPYFYDEIAVVLLTNRTSFSCFNQNIKSIMNNKDMAITNISCLERVYFAKAKSDDKTKTIITYVGMVTSVIALSLSIVVYRMTGLSDSVPGSNVENISVSLLLFTIVFLLGIGANYYSIICYSVGVILHFLWLTIFAFKSITLLHISYNLTKVSSNSVDEIRATKRNYTILGLIIPLPFLVTALAFDLFQLPGMHINYGGSVCFPTGYPANLIFVFGPIGLSLVINILCFLLIIYIVTKQSYEARNLRKINSYKYLPILARLSTVTGMFWITGLLWAFQPSEVLEYAFLVLCSFQGTFVAISNLSTRHSIRLIRSRFSKSATGVTQKVTASTIHTE